MADEHPLMFGTGHNLVGIVTAPGEGVRRNGLGAIFVNAGVVHRVGPNRLYVNLARELAGLGFMAVRFDLPGIGDSPARRDAVPFDQAAVQETRQVMTRMQQLYGVHGFVLGGLCSGAVVSFSTAVADERVVGAVLLNPQGFGGSPELLSYVVERGQSRRYAAKLLSLKSWQRALTGRSNYGYAWQFASRRWRARPPHSAIADFSHSVGGSFRSLADRGVALLLACSGGDYSLDYLEVLMGPQFRNLNRGGLHVVDLPAGDHSLTMQRSQERFREALGRWAAALAASSAARGAAGEAAAGAGMAATAGSRR